MAKVKKRFLVHSNIERNEGRSLYHEALGLFKTREKAEGYSIGKGVCGSRAEVEEVECFEVVENIYIFNSSLGWRFTNPVIIVENEVVTNTSNPMGKVWEKVMEIT